MIIANLATYPPRRSFLTKVLRSIAPQVDCVNLVLNQYDAPPDEVLGFKNVKPIIPPNDTKDAGKFYPDTSTADYVLLIDDDLIYPPDYVARTVHSFESLSMERVVAGYHCSIYRKPSLRPNRKAIDRFIKFYRDPDAIAEYRQVLWLELAVAGPVLVDQVASGTCIVRGLDLPSYDYMRSSQKFVDVRLSRWCFEQGIARVCLPREAGWLRESLAEGVVFDESIFQSFTLKNPAHVAAEIREFAFRDPRVGQAPGRAGSWWRKLANA